MGRECSCVERKRNFPAPDRCLVVCQWKAGHTTAIRPGDSSVRCLRRTNHPGPCSRWSFERNYCPIGVWTGIVVYGGICGRKCNYNIIVQQQYNKPIILWNIVLWKNIRIIGDCSPDNSHGTTRSTTAIVWK